jgi:hypothetical protein
LLLLLWAAANGTALYGKLTVLSMVPGSSGAQALYLANPASANAAAALASHEPYLLDSSEAYALWLARSLPCNCNTLPSEYAISNDGNVSTAGMF